MPKYLIEVPHDPTTKACNEAIEVFHRTGSHFLTNADWGCKDGVHKAWLIVDVESHDAAKAIPPSQYRGRSTVVQLNKFTMDEKAIIRSHPA